MDQNEVEPNIGYTCAKALANVTDALGKTESGFLELADVAFSSGASHENIIKVALLSGFHICVWCKENGGYPSDYIKRPHKFQKNYYDAELGGKICDDCIEVEEKSETKSLPSKEIIND